MNQEDNRGFTLVELLLAMAFISALLLVIAVTVLQISSMYNKGLTLRAVDISGRNLTSDMRRVFSETDPFDLESSFIEQFNPGNSNTEIEGGRLCTGSYSYVWNLGGALANTDTPPINGYETGSKTIKFVRVRDVNGEYCSNPELRVRNDDATELLSSGDHNLALQSFTISQLAEDTSSGQALYRVQMVLGTNDRGALENLNTVDTSCKPPSEDDSVQDFCAVNHFDFTAQAGYKGGQ